MGRQCVRREQCDYGELQQIIIMLRIGPTPAVTLEAVAPQARRALVR